jgi:hypothetical protein
MNDFKLIDLNAALKLAVASSEGCRAPNLVHRRFLLPVCTENWIRLDARQRLGNPAT